MDLRRLSAPLLCAEPVEILTGHAEHRCHVEKLCIMQKLNRLHPRAGTAGRSKKAASSEDATPATTQTQRGWANPYHVHQQLQNQARGFRHVSLPVWQNCKRHTLRIRRTRRPTSTRSTTHRHNDRPLRAM